MKCVWIAGLLASCLLAGNQDPLPNVNSRYTVESVELPGDSEKNISSGLREDIQRLVGEKLNPSALEDIARRIRRELHARGVSHRVVRGDQPDHVKIVYEVTRRPARFDVSVPKFLYHAKQGWSAAVEGTTTVGPNSFTFGLVSDGDELPERYAGVLARYENNKLGSDRVHLRFQFESYHEQWNRNTLEALGAPEGEVVPGVYRTRQNFEPVAAIVLTRAVTLSVGTSFERFQTQFPAARTEAANAVITTLRYHRQVEDSDTSKHDLDAEYSLRAATRFLASDFAYARHKVGARYVYTHGRHTLLDQAQAGLIAGEAPLFDRFVLGTSSTLRGWNKFDLDPRGGDRMAHNSLEYRYAIFQIFYDTGAIWDRGMNPIARHGMGVGFRKGGFALAVAFPIKEGRAEPIFMVGMNY
jgi:hypothetical protein